MPRAHWTDEQIAAYNARLARDNGLALVKPAALKPKPQRTQRVAKIREADILRSVLGCLQGHPRVAFCWRSNTGAFKVGDPARYVRVGFVGQADILGMLTDARFLAVEVKRPGQHPTPEQHGFLENVREWGGCAFVARSMQDVFDVLGNPLEAA
jgi:hypothetical protein